MKHYAGFWQRVAAFALDYILILGYLLGIFILSFAANQLFNAHQWLFADRVRAQFVAFLLVTFPVTLYLLIGLNIISLVITRTNQTLYDLLTSTYVIS